MKATDLVVRFAFMGPGALAMTAMFTSSYETTYGTFVRHVYQKTYDGMLAAMDLLCHAVEGSLDSESSSIVERYATGSAPPSCSSRT